MRKVVTAVLAIVIVATAGYFGARGWAQSRVEREVESSLAPVRASGGNVSHGPVEIELLRREVKLSDIVAETPGAAGTAFRIGRVVATGVGDPGSGRVSAARLEVEDLAFDGTLPFADGLHVTAKIPRLVFEGYSGPAAVPAAGGAASALDAVRAMLQQFTAVTAQRVTIPAMFLSVALNGGPSRFSAEYGYSGVVARDIAGGRIGIATVDKLAAAVTAPGAPNGPGGFTTEIEGMETLDADVTPVLALLAGSADDQYRRVYRKLTAGTYTVAFQTPQAPVRVTMDAFTAQDIALKPSKFPLERMIALFGTLPPPGQPPDPAQVLAALEMISGIYDGLRFGSVELRGMNATVSGQPDFRLGAFRMAGFENGRIADMAFEGVDTRTPQNEPVRIGRFALRGFAVSELMRTMGRIGAAGHQPSPDQMLALLQVLEGVEVQGMSVPAPAGAPGQTVDVDTARLSWGEFVDAFPTRVDATLRVTAPIRREDGELFAKLADAGMTTTTVDATAGLRWSEDSGVLTLQPFTVGAAGIGTIEVRAGVGNVPRAALTLDPAAFMTAIAAAEAGPVEYSLKDLGILDLMVADVARTRNLSADEARRTMMETATQPAAALVPLDPDLSGVADAVAQFLEAGGGTLTVTATPKGHVRLLPLIANARDNAAAVLGQFRIGSTVTR